MEKKRRQHYVWKHYLKAWTVDNQLFCFRDGKVFETNPNNVAIVRYFYRFKPLSESDVDAIRYYFINGMNSTLKSNAEEWLDIFLGIQEYLVKLGNHPGKSQESDELLELLEINFGEEIQTRIESNAIPIIDALRNYDVSIFNDIERLIPLTMYLGFQYFRTRKMEGIALDKMGHINTIEIGAIWGLMRVIYGFNVGSGLFNTYKTWSVKYLDVPSGFEYIASDQPLINIADNPMSDKEFEFYYPLTPELAIQLKPLSSSPGVTRSTISEDELISMNVTLAASSFEQIFARSERTLDDLLII